MESKRTIQDLSIDGGVLCLNFVNTVHDYTAPMPYDYFQNYENWLEWVARLEVLPKSRLKEIKSAEPEAKEKMLKQVREARSVLHRLFRSVARKEPVDAGVMNAFNLLLSQSLSAVRLCKGDEGPVQDWAWDEMGNEGAIRVITKSAYDLIVEGSFNRIKECGMCGWLFLDQSKNNSRRWCSMQACGSMHKAKKYYYRKKKSGEG
jgi:predicted RNA-binding Zn ribbon-like protein